jgi:PAS domain S-box-containing protein
VLLGTVVDRLRRLAAEMSRYYEVSPDLFATADLTGRCIRVSPAWERTLGHSAETIRSRPLMEFIHPDDREASIAELARLGAGGHDTLMFRARFRTIDGSHIWMQWSASVSDGLIHAVGRDITAQHDAEQLLANNATWLEAKVVERTRELDDARAETLHRLAIAAEYHNDETAQHTRRVGASAAEIAVSLRLKPHPRRRPAPRRREAGDLRHHPAQARRVDRGGVRGDEDPRCARRARAVG